MNDKAFTLIELLVVVAIIGILAAVGVNTFTGFQEKAKIAVSKSNHSTAVKKLNLLIHECHISPNGKVKLMLKQNDKTEYEKGCWHNVNTFNTSKFSDSDIEQPSVSSSTFDQNSEEVLTRHLLKLSEIEKQFQELTNKFEEINFKLDKLSTRMTKAQAEDRKSVV